MITTMFIRIGFIFVLFSLIITCATRTTAVMEDSFTISNSNREKVNQTIVMSEVTYDQLKNSLYSAEEAIDSLNSYVSRLEWAIFKLEYPKQARILELEDEWDIYIVEKGETLSDIAYGLGLRWEDLFVLNEDIIVDPDIIYPGQVLKVRRKSYEN